MDSAPEVARQIKILLSGLAHRAESAGLQDLAARLRAVAEEVNDLARKRRRKTKKKKK